MSHGYFGIGIYHPKSEVNQGTLWRSAYAFGASFIFTVGRRYQSQSSDTPNTWKHIPAYHYKTMDELINFLPIGCPIVGVELDARSSPVNQFEHPARCCYLLGAEDHGLPPSIISRCHRLIQIPSLKMCLNVATAGSIVMYDRATRIGASYEN